MNFTKAFDIVHVKIIVQTVLVAKVLTCLYLAFMYFPYIMSYQYSLYNNP